MKGINIIAQFNKRDKDATEGTVLIRAYVGGNPVASITTRYKISENQWDGQRIINHPNAKLFNAVIKDKIHQMEAAVAKLEHLHLNITKERLKAIVRGNDETRDFIAFCKERIPVDYPNAKTARHYLAECSKLQQFRANVSFSDLDHDFLRLYERYMIDTLHNSPNTVWKTQKFLKTFINKAIVSGGYIAENPFKFFKMQKYKQTQRTYLEVEECDAIMKIAADENRTVILRRVAIYFLLMCYSGLRFEDAMSFDPDKHVIDGQRIVKHTSKGFGKVVNIQLYGRLRLIVDLLRTHRLSISNQKFNVYLKAIQDIAGIRKNLTAHVGRHTFGGFMVDMGIDEEARQQALGHHDIKATRIYSHMKDAKLNKEISKLEGL